jgi:hypothetical protein
LRAEVVITLPADAASPLLIRRERPRPARTGPVVQAVRASGLEAAEPSRTAFSLNRISQAMAGTRRPR